MVSRIKLPTGFPEASVVILLALLCPGCGDEDPSDPGDQDWEIPNEGPGAAAYQLGLEYANLQWVCGPDNLTASCSSGYSSPCSPGPQIGVCYDWGGYVTIEDFLSRIAAGYGAGSAPGVEILSCTAGVDASGLVSRAWGLGAYHTTQGLLGIGVAVEPGDIAVGDAWCKAGYHVVIQGPAEGPHTCRILHASPDSLRVIEEIVESSFFEGYQPIRNEAWLPATESR